MKKKYPRNEDIRQLIKRLSYYYGHPHDFPDEVLNNLVNEGYDVSFLSKRRIWRLYEEMVRKGEIEDFLDVVIR